MQIVNDISKRGIVVGWDPLKLGNALSTVATLFVLSRRTGLPTVFPYADRYSDVFQRRSKLSRIHLPRGIDEEKLERLLHDLHATLESLPHIANIEGSSFDDLGKARVGGVVWFSKHEASLSDWRYRDAERLLRTFCRRGNGVVLQGAYWRQYRDMRELHKEGYALRTHLGPLRDSDTEPRTPPATYKVGLHLRLGDYQIWMNGQYFFPLETYRAIADRIHAEMGDRPHVFRIVSDQVVEAERFAGLPVEMSNGDMFEDFTRLSQCDVVVGPPSTFSTWAAFCGRTKRIVLTRERTEATGPILQKAIDIPFPTGAYLPNDPLGAPI